MKGKGKSKVKSETTKKGGGAAATMPPGMVRPQGKALSSFKVPRKISK